MFAYQAEPGGIGDAILCARDFIGEEYFAFLVPDQLFIGLAGAISQMASKKLPPNAAVSNLIRIPASELDYFPGAGYSSAKSYALQSDVVAITGIELAECALFPCPSLPPYIEIPPQCRGNEIPEEAFSECRV